MSTSAPGKAWVLLAVSLGQFLIQLDLTIDAGTGYGAVWWPFVIMGLGYGLLSTPMAAAVLGAVPRERAGTASSTNLTARVAGGVFGVAVLGALFSSGGGAGSGLHGALSAAAAVALARAVLTAAFIPGRSPVAGSGPGAQARAGRPHRTSTPPPSAGTRTG